METAIKRVAYRLTINFQDASEIPKRFKKKQK